MHFSFLRPLALAIAALVGVASTNQAMAVQIIRVKTVALVGTPPTVHISDAVVNKDVYMGMTRLTLVDNTSFVVNCLSPDLSVGLGDYSSAPLQFQVTTLEDVLPSVSSTTAMQVAALIKMNSLSPSIYAYQGGIWDKIGGGPIVTTSDVMQQTLINAYYASTATTPTSSIVAFKSVDPTIQSFSCYGCTIPTQTTVVPEPATWAMMLFGFLIVGSTLRSQRPRHSFIV